MAGRIEQLIGVTIDTGVKLYRDVSINSGTKALFDVSSSWAGGKKNVVTGDQIKSLGYDDTLASFTKSHTYQTGGMVFTGVNGDMFSLPANASPLPGDKHWLVTQWLKINTYGLGTVGVNNQICNFSASNLNVLGSATFTIAYTAVDGSSPSTVNLFARGQQFNLATQLAPLFDGSLHQLAVEYELNEDKTQRKLTVYIDKEQVFSSGFGAAASTVPADPTYMYVGTHTAFPKAWTGSFYRFRKDDLTATDLTAMEVITADYSSAIGRFA